MSKAAPLGSQCRSLNTTIKRKGGRKVASPSFGKHFHLGAKTWRDAHTPQKPSKLPKFLNSLIAAI